MAAATAPGLRPAGSSRRRRSCDTARSALFEWHGSPSLWSRSAALLSANLPAPRLTTPPPQRRPGSARDAHLTPGDFTIWHERVAVTTRSQSDLSPISIAAARFHTGGVGGAASSGSRRSFPYAPSTSGRRRACPIQLGVRRVLPRNRACCPKPLPHCPPRRPRAALGHCTAAAAVSGVGTAEAVPTIQLETATHTLRPRSLGVSIRSHAGRARSGENGDRLSGCGRRFHE